MSLLFNLLFSSAELPSINKLELSWMVLQNSIMTKNQQLWVYRRILNETMTTMITLGYISKKQLFELNHCIVLELQQVEDKFEDLIESETKMITPVMTEMSLQQRQSMMIMKMRMIDVSNYCCWINNQNCLEIF